MFSDSPNLYPHYCESPQTCIHIVNNVLNLLEHIISHCSRYSKNVSFVYVSSNCTKIPLYWEWCTEMSLNFTILRASPEVLLDNIRWTFTNTSGGTADITNTTMSGRHTFTSDLLQLTITNISRVDEGNYTLTATNPAGMEQLSSVLKV